MKRFADNVAINQSESYLIRGRNITTDGFFYKFEFIRCTEEKNTTLISTINRVRKEYPTGEMNGSIYIFFKIKKIYQTKPKRTFYY